jgi:hypothetical protein
MTRAIRHGSDIAAKCILPTIHQLADQGGLKKFIQENRGKKRQRVVAMLYTMYTAREIAEMFGVKQTYVVHCALLHKDIIEAAKLARQQTIAGLAERRAVEILSGMDVSKISEDKKPQAVKYLVDSADIANRGSEPQAQRQDEDTMELVFKIKRRMGAGGAVPAKAVVEDDREVIDAEVTEVPPPKQLPNADSK